MNLNIQSLNSKHSNLSLFLEELSTNKVTIEILALQEIWNIPNLPSIEIPNYNFTFKKRSKFRGGGVGFYIKKGIPYKVSEHLSFFHEKLFECLTIEIQLRGKKI